MRFPKRVSLFRGSLLDMSFSRSNAISAAVAPEVNVEIVHRSFESFFEAESPILFRRLCLVTGNRQEAEEVMQDAFLKLFERWERVSGLEDPTGYLYRTAFNVFRKRTRRAGVALRRTLRMAPAGDEFAAAEARHVVAQALSKLTARQRAALVLTELLDYDSEEAGRLLGVRASTIRALATQGRATMRRTLERQDV
jgi:RNA polymerase sigma-70 factor (ECF subfamily)